MIPDTIKYAARELRKNMTLAEKILWKELEKGKIGEKFQKQKPIFVYEENSGFKRYIIADFICLEKKLIIEVDGNIHELEEILELDTHKETLLKARGYKILRFTNTEIQTNIQKVLLKIQSSFTYSTSESPPFNKKGGGLQS